MSFQVGPWYHGIPRASTKLFDNPWYSICSDLPHRLIFHTITRYSSISQNILVHAAGFQDRPWHHEIPRCSRHSSCSLTRPAFFSFLWQGWLGWRCPHPAIQKYPQSSACEAEGRYGTFSGAWYHDIRHSIMFLNILWYFSTISELPRRPMISWHSTCCH